MTVEPDDALAAREERLNEAGLDAEHVYRLIVEAAEEDAIEYVRALLRMRAEVTEVLNNTIPHRRR
jgi:hypothetical protein